MTRKNWPEYFMDIATEVASRATCDRKSVGCVIVKDNRILSTGYNGSIVGSDHCNDVGHMMEDGHCVRVIHAELNAIIQAAKYGVSIDKSTCYVTASPCWNCFKALANSGIVHIIYNEFYRDERIFREAQRLNIKLQSLSECLQKSVVLPDYTNLENLLWYYKLPNK